MKKVKTIVLRVDGTNCDEETVIAFRKAGSEVDLVHMNELIRKEKSLEDYQILCIPGGFTYGDDIAAGKIFAVLLKYKIGKDVKKFVEDGKLVIGICNGFQVLVKAGILPALEGIMKKQEATLAFNDCGYFQDRWVYLKHENKRKCIFTRGIKNIIHVPVNHAEGKFVADKNVIRKLEENDQIVFKYVDPDGNYASFPWNPNGSIDNIAGICNTDGNVFGLMPHPEKFIHKYMHPCWTRIDLPEKGDGFKIFKNAVEFAEKKL
jgi:phosphoribosylformylglycinamidine synthase